MAKHPAHSNHSSRSSCSARTATSSKTCALCPVFGRCGACDLLDVPYDDQLAQKQRTIEDLFANRAPRDAFHDILGMADPFHYRNKVTSPFVAGKPTKGLDARGGKGNRGGQHSRPEILTGMYERGTHKVIPTKECLLENEVGQRVVEAIRQIMMKHGMEPYDEDTGRGFIRHVIVRVGHHSDEVLVTLVTNGREFPHSKSFCRELIKRVPEVTSVVQNVNTRQTNVILGEEDRPLYGPGFILDELCAVSFRISPQSFYQVNAAQTEVLYDKAIELAAVDESTTLIDAYCGTGTIGLVGAKRGAARVIGVDSVASAIRDARQNAKHNGLPNAEFVCEDATGFMAKMAAARKREARESTDGERGSAAEPERLVIMMDPPRAGSTPEFLKAAVALAPDAIVYISCDPRTQARDSRVLRDLGYEIDEIWPVDMFPHTSHIESIVRFRSATR